MSTTGLGDTIWATPAIEELRAAFPDLYIAVLTSPIGGEVLLHNPCINRIYLLKKSWIGQIVSLTRQLGREHFDTILVFHASQRIALFLVSLLGAKRVLGTQGLNKGMDWILTDPLPATLQHEAERRLKMVEQLGIVCTGKVPRLELSPNPNSQFLISRRMDGGPWVALHPGAKEVFRRWPLTQWIELARRLHQKSSCQFLITGSGAERDLMESLHREIPAARLLPDGASFLHMAGLLSQMDLLISNDTGPLHAAAALGRPVVGLYVATDPRLCGPFRAIRSTLVVRDPTCQPCLKKQCRLPFCMLQIPVEEVLEAACNLLDEP